MIKVLFPIFASTWCVNKSVSRQVGGINRRNESTLINSEHCAVLHNNSCVLLKLNNCCFLKTWFCWETTFLNCVILILRDKAIQSSQLLKFFPSSKIMETLRIGRKIAAIARETQEYPRNNQSQNSAASGITEDYLAQVSKEIEGGVTEKLSQEFSRTESRFLGALSNLDEFLLNQQIRTFSGITLGTFQNTDIENQEPSGDRCQNDPHPEVEFSACRASNPTDSDPDETSHTTHVFILGEIMHNQEPLLKNGNRSLNNAKPKYSSFFFSSFNSRIFDPVFVCNITLNWSSIYSEDD